MLTTPAYHSICKVLHYSAELLTRSPFEGLHLRFVTACAISVSSNTKWALQDAGQSVSDTSSFPSTPLAQPRSKLRLRTPLLLHHCGSHKRTPVAGVQNHFAGEIFHLLISLIFYTFKAQTGSRCQDWLSCTCSHLYWHRRQRHAVGTRCWLRSSLLPTQHSL